MSEDVMMRNIRFLIFGENEWRVSARRNRGIWQIRIDVHRMTAAEAKKMLHNLITLMPCEVQICVVHGYHNGTAIKETLRKEFISDRICHMETPEYNPGITWMNIADRCGKFAAA